MKEVGLSLTVFEGPLEAPLFLWATSFMAQPWRREAESIFYGGKKIHGLNIVPVAYFISVCHWYFYFIYGVFQGQTFLICMVSNLSAFP